MRHSKPVQLKTAPTGPDKSGSKTRGESVYLFLEFTISWVSLYSIYNQVLLNNRISSVLERDPRLTVQPNLRTVKCQQNLCAIIIPYLRSIFESKLARCADFPTDFRTLTLTIPRLSAKMCHRCGRTIKEFSFNLSHRVATAGSQSFLVE